MLNRLDIIGFSASAICAVHCMLVPVLVVFAGMQGLQILENPLFENVIILFSLTIGVSSLLPSYINRHRRSKALIILVFGFCLIGISRLEVSKVLEISLTSGGAVVIAIAHFINRKLCKQCKP